MPEAVINNYDALQCPSRSNDVDVRDFGDIVINN